MGVISIPVALELLNRRERRERRVREQRDEYRTMLTDLILLVFGASQPTEKLDIDFKTRYLGTLSDEIYLALIYAAADVFVAPSVHENLPNTVIEALACRTPCVAFQIGGMPDLIEHKQNGYFAHPFATTEDLAPGIAWVLESRQRWQV